MSSSPEKLTGSESQETSPVSKAVPYVPGQKLGRYEIVRKLGQGGMGRVFEARDMESQAVVALKTLRHLDAATPLRLKREFRSMANVAHPNLVSLHELFSVDGESFFTMERIEGQDLAALLRGKKTGSGSSGSPSPQVVPPEATLTAGRVEPNVPEGKGAAAEATPADATATADGLRYESSGSNSGTGSSQNMVSSVPAAPPMELDRVRQIMRELAAGIYALHQHGKLHRDIKPGNVMVADNGRVVLLDFGLIDEQARYGDSHSSFAGTPAYMSPERVMGEPATESSDWYAFGVILYEALTGTRPFAGEALKSRVERDVPRLEPSPDIPEELRTLCLALLDRDPAARPQGREVLERLGVALPPTALSGITQLEEQSLRGREEHFAALRKAFDTMKGGRTEVVWLQGRSGMGKSVLARKFVQEVLAEGAVVLAGNCYERESVPYKAVDGVVDSLAYQLRRLPAETVQALKPAHVADLLRIFPNLRRVKGFASDAVAEPADLPRDRIELRRRAFRALKELLARWGRQAPLVVFIDDMQWADLDSSAALMELLSPPDMPRLMLLCGFRSGETVTSPFLTELRKMLPLLQDGLELREVEVGPLPERDTKALAAALLERGEEDPLVASVATESRGSPFFVGELARLARERAQEGGAAGSGVAVRIDQVVAARQERLPEGARRLMEMVAVAGKPVAQGIVAKAAGLEGDVQPAWTYLRAHYLVRTQGMRSNDLVESLHDQIRESIYARLDPAVLRERHLRLATELEAAGGADEESLASHYMAAGAKDKAAPHVLKAAEHALQTMAFHRAAELYRQALECIPEDWRLLEKRADALANVGRCEEAAAVYLQAADRAPVAHAPFLRRRAAEQLMMGGHIDRGLTVLKPLLAERKLPWPATPGNALMRIMGRMILFNLRGYGYRERPESEVRPEVLSQIDVATAAGMGLGPMDVMRGVYFNIRLAQLALEAGEPKRISHGLSCLGVGLLSQGTPGSVKKGHQLFAEAVAIGERLGNPFLVALAWILKGIGMAVLGEWKQAIKLLEDGARLLEERCVGRARELSTAHVNLSNMLRQVGELRDLSTRGTQWLREAEENGDRFLATVLRFNLSSVLLAADRQDEAMEQLDRAVHRARLEQFTPELLYGVILAAECDLYRDVPEAARKRLADVWPEAKASFALGWQFYRVHAVRNRAGAAVALAARAPESERPALFAEAEKFIRQLDKEKKHYPRAGAAALRGAIAAIKGQRDQALRELDAAVALYEEAELPLQAACARRQKGVLVGGDEGRALIERADAVLRAQDIRFPDRWARMWAPGFPAPR